MKKIDYTYVDNSDLLRKIVFQISKASELGVDLEADSMFHYQEKVCILQLSSKSANFIIDTLAVKDLSPLKRIFSDPKIKKIFHGADYDIRSLKRDFNIEIQGLFDTQIAARFIGVKETGLANLLNLKLGISLEKKYQKKDWSQRPLNEKMISYAVNDSLHLIKLARNLEYELIKLGRLSYAQEEFETLSKVRYEPKKQVPIFLNFNGAGSLDRRSLAVLEELLIYRQKQARRLDRPPFKVMGNSPILDLVKKKPKTIEELKLIKGLSPKQIDNFGGHILKRVLKALAVPEHMLPFYPTKNRNFMDGKTSKRIKTLKKWRERKASELGIDPPLVFSNAAIRPIAVNCPSNQEGLKRISELRRWQIKEFGEEICALIS